ncbi:MAG: MATE family efflux transporter [Coleofasciculaceae cyanobacterium SM2_1_6]|nr:MATE family efflux transporter [Coleofasciculaceae cyanobacterium SM2_1_6]
MVPLAGLVDVAFLGHLAEIRHLAGVAIATVLFNYIYWTFGFLRMGTTGLTAQAVGRGDPREVLLVGLRNSLLALGLGAGILMLQYPLRELGFSLLSATAAVKLSGQMYYNALIWGAPATLLNFVLLGWFLGRSQGRQVFLLSVVGNLANIILDYFFINKFGWESAGAGAATAMSQYLMTGAGLGLIALESKSASGIISPINFPRFSQLWEAEAFKATVSLNRDILVRTLLMVSSFAVFTNLGAGMGTIVLATNALILQIINLSAYVIDGIAFATESFAGTFYGQTHQAEINSPEISPVNIHQVDLNPGTINQQQPELLRLIWVAGGLSLAWGLAIALPVIAFPMPIFSLLTKHQEVLQQIPNYVLWLLPILSFGSLAYMLDGYFIGLTAGKVLLRSALIASLGGFAPVAFWAWQSQNPHLLWLALALFMVGRVLPMAIAIPPTLAGSTAREINRQG